MPGRSCLSRSLLVLAALVALPGCVSDGPNDAVPPVVDVAPAVSARELADRLGLELLEPDSVGRVVLDGGEEGRIVLFPGTGVVSVQGRDLDASEPVRASGGDLWIAAWDVERIEFMWEPAVVDPAPAGPAVVKPGPAVLPPPPDPLPAVRPSASALGVVVLDAGHGGKDPGTTASTGTREKDVVLAVTLAAARRLREAGAEVVLTRDGDRFVELEDRAAVGNRERARLFVSIHADAAENAAASGYTVYVRRRPTAATRDAAESIRKALSGKGPRDRGVKEAGYRVLVKSEGPAVLVELGFLSNHTEARLLARETYRETLAEALAAGIVDYLRR